VVVFLTRQPSSCLLHLVCAATPASTTAPEAGQARCTVDKIDPGELFPTVGILVTNRSLPDERVFAFYNQRSTVNSSPMRDLGPIGIHEHFFMDLLQMPNASRAKA
jgi:hypothetical protein